MRQVVVPGVKEALARGFVLPPQAQWWADGVPTICEISQLTEEVRDQVRLMRCALHLGQMSDGEIDRLRWFSAPEWSLVQAEQARREALS